MHKSQFGVQQYFSYLVLVQRLTKLIMTKSKKIMPTGVSTLNLYNEMKQKNSQPFFERLCTVIYYVVYRI